MNIVNQYEESVEDKCRGYSSWTLQILLWLMIALYYAFSLLEEQKEKKMIFTIIVLIYILYGVIELYSITFSFLNNMHSIESFKEYMNSLFNSPIIIKFQCECFHFAKRNGKENKNSKVITYKGDQSFVYNYWTDISGLFSLDEHKKDINEENGNRNTNMDIDNSNFIFLKLKLLKKYYINDRFTNNDYVKQYNSFVAKFTKIDNHILTSEASILSGFKENVLINISNEPLPFFVSKWWFIFFTFILPFAEVYSYYINSLCLVKNYTIKKQISNKFDLKKGVLSKGLLKYYPKIELFSKKKNSYEKSSFNNSNSNANNNDTVINVSNSIDNRCDSSFERNSEGLVDSNSKTSKLSGALKFGNNIVSENSINKKYYDKLKQSLI